MGQVLAIDMRGPINCFSAVLPFMVDQGGGRIVNKASGEAVYAGCKAGLIGFSKTIANEMARHKINVSVVCPGRIGTPLLEEVTGGMQGVRIIEAMVKAVAWRRLAEPDEIASAVAFFASADTRFCAGQVLTVSGAGRWLDRQPALHAEVRMLPRIESAGGPGTRQRSGAKRTGRCSMPLMKFERRRSGGPSISIPGNRRNNSSKST